jgi:hypothetical protein
VVGVVVIACLLDRGGRVVCRPAGFQRAATLGRVAELR